MINDEAVLSDAAKWKGLYRLAGIAAILIVAFIPIQATVFALWPPPATPAAWFTLFRKNQLIGLLDMDLLLIVDYILSLIVFIALWAALRRKHPALASFVIIIQIVATATYFASSAAFEMLHLSKLYDLATTDAEKTIYLASGQTMLSIWQGSAFNISYILGCIASVTVSFAMLRSGIFSKTNAWFGLSAGILMILPPTAGTIGIIISFLSLLPAIPWLILLASRFFQLSRLGSDNVL